LNLPAAMLKSPSIERRQDGNEYPPALDVVGGLRDACPRRAAASRVLSAGRFVRAAAGMEPPVDVLETERAVLVLVALPGVNPDRVEASIDGSDLVFSGNRVLPAEMRTAIIHRLELPQGRFERRVRLPAGRYSAVQRSACDGCLVITLQKSGGVRG
jgi:HSP20 family protein